ncbi:WXG100 family type VII secretion target [Streptomyces sp. NPDC001493]
MTTPSTGNPDMIATPREPFTDGAVPALDRVRATGQAPAADPSEAVSATDRVRGADASGTGHPDGAHASLNDRHATGPNGAGTQSKTGSKTETKTETGHGSSGGSHGTMSAEEFRVALARLSGAIGVVRAEGGHIADLLGQIRSCFESAQSSWQSPSAVSFETMSTWFTDASHGLADLLQDMARRMQTAYDNYAAAETANTHNSGG